MSKSHRAEAFGETESGYLWCLHCERAYKENEYRVVWEHGDEFQMCHYEDCDGSTVMDGWAWETFRENNTDLPIEPELDKVYPLYPKSDTP